MALVIDDFEDGDVSGWTLDTTSFTADNSSPLAGSYSGALQVDAEFEQVRSPGAGSPTAPLELLIRADQQTGIALDRFSIQIIDSGGSFSNKLDLAHDGNIVWNNSDTGTNWATGTTYTLRFEPDFGSDTVDILLDGNPITTGAPLGGISDIDKIEVEANNQNGGGSGTLWVDDIVVDIGPPATPNNVSIDVEDDDTATTTWDENGTKSDPTEYEVDIKTDGGSWTRVADLGGAARSHTETLATATDTVQFRVRAKNSGGASSWVSTSTESTNPSSLSVTSSDATGIDLSWTDPSANDGTDILLADSSGSVAADYQVGQSIGASASTTTVSGLENGEQYFIRVQATYSGADGTPSPVTNEVVATTDLPAPVIDSLDASTEGEVTVNYTLADNSADGDVLVERSTDGGSSWSAAGTVTDLGATSYTDSGLDDGEQYTYRLTRRTDHASTQSGTAQATTVLPAPTGVTVDAINGDQIDLSWTDNADNGDYRVLVSDDDGATWTTDGDTLGSNATSYTTSNLLDGERYLIAVEVYTPHATSRDHIIVSGTLAVSGTDTIYTTTEVTL